MKHEINYLVDYLKKYDVKTSNIRLYILDLMLEKDKHLTVDEIYTELKDIVPTLSKTSVYNTLELFEEHGLIAKVKMDEKEARYDIRTHPHGHFKCVKCKEIFDFGINIIEYKDLKEFKILKEDVQIYGLCEKCK